MSAWWSTVRGEVKEHTGPRPQFQALIRLHCAVTMSGVLAEECGLYKRDPRKHPDEPNAWLTKVEKARVAQLANQLRGIMKKGRRR